MFAVLLASALAVGPEPGRIHSVSDLSHEFTFYMDGRFHRQYIGEHGVDVRNWGTLWKCDLRDANLLVLASEATRVPYDPRTVRHVRRFVEEGGGLVVLSDARSVRDGQAPPVEAVTREFGARFSRTAAEPPLRRPDSPDSAVEFSGGGTLELSSAWRALVRDARGRPVMARRPLGKGQILVAVRGLFGRRPDAGDPLNRVWITPLLLDLVKGKPVDPARPPREHWAVLTRRMGSFVVEFHEGTRPWVDRIVAEYEAVRPVVEQVMGVPPAEGMISRLLILPTGAAGFSSGERIAIGAWWGNYPERRYPMVELIAHEATHSWVVPHPEPVWNEPIATYVGIVVGRRMGMEREADESFRRTLERGRALDPDWTRVDIARPDAPLEVVWAKAYHIFSELERRFGEDALARYFRAKRRLVAADRPAYTLDDSVAVWSRALGEDLFPFFRSLGLDVDPQRTDIPVREEAP